MNYKHYQLQLMTQTNLTIIVTFALAGLLAVSVNAYAPEELPNLERYSNSSITLEASSNDIKEAISLEQLSYNESVKPVEPKISFEEQRSSIEAYRQMYFPNSPITTDMIIKVSQHYQIPVNFVLAVGHNESHMGTKGRAVETMNPMNVGNVTEGDYKATNCTLYSNCLSGWEEGLDQFASLITRCYFHEGEAIKLQTWIDRDFRAVRCGLEGKRYMTDWRALAKYQERIQNLQSLNIAY